MSQGNTETAIEVPVLHESGGDLHIVQSVIEGDAENYRILLEKYREPLMQYIYGMCWNEHTSAETLKESSLLAFNALERIPDKDDFLSFWLRAARRQLQGHLPPIGDFEPEALSIVQARELLLSLRNNTVSADSAEGMAVMIQRLPIEEREAWVLNHLAHIAFSVAENAKVAAATTLHQRLTRAEEILESRLNILVKYVGEHQESESTADSVLPEDLSSGDSDIFGAEEDDIFSTDETNNG